jgi:dTDP-glucose pyrophosphorylase
MLNILIPMAGSGSRFAKTHGDTPKPLIDINGAPMILRAINTLGFSGNYIFIIQDDKKIDELLSFYGTTIVAKELTDGPTCSALLAKEHIDNNNPLVIANCDQIMEWKTNDFTRWLKQHDPDGAIVTYNTNRKHNSYARIGNCGFVTEIKEKEVISNISLNGIHYWKYGKDFVKSANDMIEKKITVNGEYYIAPTYNELIAGGAKIKHYHIPEDQHWAVGTPEDLQTYLDHENKKTKRL